MKKEKQRYPCAPMWRLLTTYTYPRTGRYHTTAQNKAKAGSYLIHARGGFGRRSRVMTMTERRVGCIGWVELSNYQRWHACTQMTIYIALLKSKHTLLKDKHTLLLHSLGYWSILRTHQRVFISDQRWGYYFSCLLRLFCRNMTLLPAEKVAD